MSGRFEEVQYVKGWVKCDECEKTDDFGSFDNYESEDDVFDALKINGWRIAGSSDDANDIDLCPKCYKARENQDARDQRFLNGKELYRASEIGIDPIGHVGSEESKEVA